ncbi:MAG: ATP-dependent RNA helicase RhlE, partial [Bacteroidetes bacterium]|nr:ATP-dependent RNA helicase RhlE [Bacteroidota bacterium]
EAISIVSVDENDYIKGIEKLLGQRLESDVIEGFEPTESLQDVLEKKAENKAANQRGRQNSRKKEQSGGSSKKNTSSQSRRRNSRRR